MFHKGWEKNCPESNKKREKYEKEKYEYINLVRNWQWIFLEIVCVCVCVFKFMWAKNNWNSICYVYYGFYFLKTL